MPTFRVLQTLPKGQQPGTLVELNDDEARVFLAVGAIEPDSQAPSPKPSRRYRRRDLEAESPEEPKA